MKIKNIRLHHATNSSSCHSCIIIPPSMVGKVFDNDADGDYFGWEDFTLVSDAAKLQYFISMIRPELEESFPPNLVNLFITSVQKDYLLDADLVIETDFDIDHQSVLQFPVQINNSKIDLQFAEEFLHYVKRDDIAVIGGNDNGGGGDNPLESVGKIAPPYEAIDSYGKLTSKKDGDWWILHNQDTGVRVTFSFLDDPIRGRKTADLIDVKITDYCRKGCLFCYQGSTTAGVHCDWDINSLRTLEKLRPFEVVLGGGEPTDHPQFLDIIKDISTISNVTFTTAQLGWISDNEVSTAVQKYCKTFAYSANSAAQVTKLKNTLEDAGWDMHKRPTIHIVMGTVGYSDFCEILKRCKSFRFNVTLLGYKSLGRGIEYSPTDYRWWLKIVQESEYYRISIDTALARQYEKEIRDTVGPRFFDITASTIEGDVSCYIDLVEKVINRSSWESRPGLSFAKFPEKIVEWFNALKE